MELENKRYNIKYSALRKRKNGIFLEYAPFAKYTISNDKVELIEKEKEMMIPLMGVFE